MAIYLNYNSLGIKGDATQQSHKDWITINSLQFGVGRGISTPVGSAKNREQSEPSFSEITVSKSMDLSSVLLCQDAAINKKGVTVIIDFVRTGDKGDIVYLQFTLTNTLISAYSLSSGGDQPSESMSLNFTKLEYSYTGMKEDGTTENPNKFTYDLALGTQAS